MKGWLEKKGIIKRDRSGRRVVADVSSWHSLRGRLFGMSGAGIGPRAAIGPAHIRPKRRPDLSLRLHRQITLHSVATAIVKRPHACDGSLSDLSASMDWSHVVQTCQMVPASIPPATLGVWARIAETHSVCNAAASPEAHGRPSPRVAAAAVPATSLAETQLQKGMTCALLLASVAATGDCQTW